MTVIFNLANAITASRFLLLYPFWALYDGGRVGWAVSMILISGILDKLDGFVAKRLGVQSRFGEVFDSVTDGLCYGFYLFVLALYRPELRLPIGLIIALGAANSTLRGLFLRRTGGEVYRSWAMERAVGYLAFVCGLITLGIREPYFAWTCAAFVGAITLHDARRMLLDPVVSEAGQGGGA